MSVAFTSEPRFPSLSYAECARILTKPPESQIHGLDPATLLLTPAPDRTTNPALIKSALSKTAKLTPDATNGH